MGEELMTGIPTPVVQVPAAQAIPGTPASTQPQKFTTQYPIVEEMTFRGVINSEEEGYALLRAIQILVNNLGTATIIKVVSAIEKNPRLLDQAKMYMPYLGLM